MPGGDGRFNERRGRGDISPAPPPSKEVIEWVLIRRGPRSEGCFLFTIFFCEAMIPDDEPATRAPGRLRSAGPRLGAGLPRDDPRRRCRPPPLVPRRVGPDPLLRPPRPRPCRLRFLGTADCPRGVAGLDGFLSG